MGDEDIFALASVICSSLSRNKMLGRDGKEKLIVQWDLAVEEDNELGGKWEGRGRKASLEVRRRVY